MRSRVLGLSLCVGLLLAAEAGGSRVFAFDETVLYNFCGLNGCADGRVPLGGVIMDGARDIFGTTNIGGVARHCDNSNNGCGTVFELHLHNGFYLYRALHSFCAAKNCRDGGFPTGALIQDVSGNLYGVTTNKGAHNAGGVFEITGNKLKVLHAFCAKSGCTDGTPPDSTATPLTYAGASAGAPYDGNAPLYGFGYAGGTHGNGGVIYELAKNSKGKLAYKVIYNFCSQSFCGDGSQPMGLIADGAGTLYGASVNGGVANKGVVFKFDGKNLQTLYTFCSQSSCTDGANPRGPVVFDASGNMYGTTFSGGASDNGTAYEISAAGVYSKLYDFCSAANCADGANPAATPVIDAKGFLYGTTPLGGANQAGVVYKLKGSSYQVLYSFCPDFPQCTDGDSPNTPVTLDSSGNIFGTGVGGGTGQIADGVVFELSH
jgi:uncharacterized repeat protein (TIGR03803 family)